MRGNSRILSPKVYAPFRGVEEVGGSKMAKQTLKLNGESEVALKDFRR